MIRRAIVTREVLEKLRPAMDGDDNYFLWALKNDVCEAWSVNDGDAYMITRIEIFDDTREMVVCCFSGSGLRKAAPHIIDMARRVGCDSVRFHSRRSGVFRMVKKLGFHKDGYRTAAQPGHVIYTAAI